MTSGRSRDGGALPFSQHDLILGTSVFTRLASPTRPGVPPAAPPRRRRVHKAASDVRVGRVDGRGRSVDTFANGSGQNGRRAPSQAVSAIDRPARVSSGARLCAGGPAGAGAGAGVSDAIMRTQMSHRRIVQHRPDVSQAWSARRTPLRRLRLPGAERSSLKPAAFELFGAAVVLLEPHDSRGGELARCGAVFARQPWRSPWAALPRRQLLTSTKRQHCYCKTADRLWVHGTHPGTVFLQSQKIQIV